MPLKSYEVKYAWKTYLRVIKPMPSRALAVYKIFVDVWNRLLYNDILFVVYTERVHTIDNGKTIETTRLISARMATNFERGLYYGKFD